MACTYLWGTGWELGYCPYWSGRITYGGSIIGVAGGGHNGTYYLDLANAWYNYALETPRTDVSQGVWLSTGGGGAAAVRFGSSDRYIEITRGMAPGSLWALSINGVATATGIVPAPNGWQNVQIWVSFHPTDGYVRVKTDGLLDINYTGATCSGSTNITNVQIESRYPGTRFGWDDWTVGYGDYTGDRRYDKLMVTGDVTPNQWTTSTGTDHYALVDEVGPNDNDYLYADITAQRELFSLADWAGAADGKTPSFLVHSIRVKKDTANSQQIKLLEKSGSTENLGPAIDPLMNYETRFKCLNTNPDGNVAWTEAALNALQIGFESLVP